MKKRILTIVSLLMTLIMSMACFSGCNMVVLDSDKDIEQTVATVSIADGVEDKILKRDLIMSYLNYGSTYIQSYGYTQEKTVELLLDSLINNRILIQNAMLELSKTGQYSVGDKWEVATYLTEKEKIEAEYETIKAVDHLVEEFGEHEHDAHYNDAIPGTIRTTPTNAANDEEVPYGDKVKYVEEHDVSKGGSGITSKTDSTDEHEIANRRNAFNKAVNMLKMNSLLGNYDGKDLMTTEYYKVSVTQQYEAKLIEKFRFSINSVERAKVTFDDLSQEYVEMLEEQQNWNNYDFVDLLTNSNPNKPILYGVNGNYGYVYNLLLGVNDIQSERIKDIDADISNADRESARRVILDATTIVDMRDSWINSGYDFDYDDQAKTGVFTGDYTFAKDPANSLKFQGVVEEVECNHEHDHGSDEEYRAKATTMDLDQFIEIMETYVYGATLEGDEKFSKGSYYKGVEYNGQVEEYKAKIQELLFAFSTDNGSLNNENGYLIKPAPDGDVSEEYVETFAKAGRELIEMGGNSYVIVASDYGYHVMFFSEVYNVGSAVADTLEEYLNYKYSLEDYKDADGNKYASWLDFYNDMLANWNDWEYTDNFLYILQDAKTSLKVTNQQNLFERNIVNKYTYEVKDSIVIFEKAYQDLLGK